MLLFLKASKMANCSMVSKTFSQSMNRMHSGKLYSVCIISDVLLKNTCLCSDRLLGRTVSFIQRASYSTYLLMPIAPGGAFAIKDPSPSHSVLGCSGYSGPVGPLLFQLCFSVSPPTVARPASLPLPLRVPDQGLVCGTGCWLPEGVSDPAPLPPQYLLGHWFLSRWIPQIFISDLLLPHSQCVTVEYVPVP